MHDITVLVIIKNAEATLDTCLKSVDWADDIFCVLDPSSSDSSHEIARAYTNHIVEHEYTCSSDQLNWAIPQIKTEWTLVLDSDECLLDPLRERIQTVIKNKDSLNGYSIKRLTYFFGRLIKHCGWHRDYNVRLFRTAKGRYDDRRVHASMIIDGEVGTIHEVMLHDSYQTFSDYMRTLDSFTTRGAEERFSKGRKFRAADILLRPPLRFFKMYILRHGFLDGFHGIVLCGLASCTVFIKYAKLWNLERMHKDGQDISLTRD